MSDIKSVQCPVLFCNFHAKFMYCSRQVFVVNCRSFFDRVLYMACGHKIDIRQSMKKHM